MNIKVPYRAREWAVKFHNTDKRWIILVCHRRSGKTTASLNHLQRDALKIHNSRFAYVAPTYKQAKNVAWDMIKWYSKIIPGIEYNESELAVKYPNGSKLTLYGADNPDALRGIGLWGVIFDEYGQQPSNIFTEVIRPTLADHKGYAIWIGTPKGKNDFWRVWEKAQTDDAWFKLILKASDSNLISPEELADAKKTQSPEEYEQEWECSFEASIKGAYYAQQLRQAREEGRIGNIPHDEMVKVSTWWDLGIADSTAIGFFQNVGHEWRLIDYYEASGEGLSHYLQVLRDKPYQYDRHYAPHDIQVRELGSGKSRIEMAKSLGIRFEIVPKLNVMDGINAARSRFNTLWIDEQKCERFLNAISLYRKEYNEQMGEFKPRPYHDWTSHAADMIRYWAVTKTKVKTPIVTQPDLDDGMVW